LTDIVNGVGATWMAGTSPAMTSSVADAGSSRRRRTAWTPFAAAQFLSTPGVVAAGIAERDLIGYTIEFQSNYRATFSGDNVNVTQDRVNTYAMTFLDGEQVSVRLSIAIHPVGGGADSVENRSGIVKLGKAQATAAIQATVVEFAGGTVVLTSEWAQGASQVRVNVHRQADGFTCSAKETIAHLLNTKSIEVVDPSTGRRMRLEASPPRTAYCRVFKS